MLSDKKSLSPFSKLTDRISTLSQDIEDKIKEKESLVEMNTRLKWEINKIKNNIRSVVDEQRVNYQSADFNVLIKHNISNIEKDIEKHTKHLLTMGNYVLELGDTNQDIKLKIENEKAKVINFKNKVKELRNSISANRKYCCSLKKRIVQIKAQNKTLEQKHEKALNSLATLISILNSNDFFN